MPTGCAARYVTPERFLSFPTGATGSASSDTTRSYRGRHLIENAFCRLKDFRGVATRYDKHAANFLSGVAIATALAFWL